MSDRFNAELELGGNCPAGKVQELVNLILISGWYLMWDDDNHTSRSEEVMEELHRPKVVGPHFTQHDTRVDLQDELLDFLKDNQISFIFRVSGDIAYDGDITWWVPGMNEARSVTADVNAKEAVVNQQWLERLAAREGTLQDAIAILKNSPPELETFRIVQDEKPA